MSLGNEKTITNGSFTVNRTGWYIHILSTSDTNLGYSYISDHNNALSYLFVTNGATVSGMVFLYANQNYVLNSSANATTKLKW